MSCSKRVLTLNTLMSGWRGYNFGSLTILSLCFWLVGAWLEFDCSVWAWFLGWDWLGWFLVGAWFLVPDWLTGLTWFRGWDWLGLGGLGFVLGLSLIFRISALLMWLPHHQSQEVGLELVEHQKIFDKSRRNHRFALKRQEQKLKYCVGKQNLRSFMPCLSNDDFALCCLILFGWEWRLGLFKAFKSNRNRTEKPGCLKGDFSS